MAMDGLRAAGLVRAARIDGSLRPRVVGLAESLTGPSWFAALIEDGNAHIAGEEAPVAAPALLWRRWRPGARITFGAGASATYVLLGATALSAATGHRPDAQDMRETADRDHLVPLARRGAAFAALAACFSGIRREVQGDAPAAQAVVEAYLRVILVELHRSAMGRLWGDGHAAPSRRIFARFSALVEQHFRDRWPVHAYARALGVSRDRLGDICRRARGIGPKQMIDRRLAAEARQYLQHSGSSVQQVAGLLGFASTAQFSRFFVRMAGQPPGAYRAAAAQDGDQRSQGPDRPYNWP